MAMAAKRSQRPARAGGRGTGPGRNPAAEADDATLRQRILSAAFAAFMENGYAETSTLEIATRARVSKRALYEEVGNKQEMLVACIAERAKRLQLPSDLPSPTDRATLARLLTAFGAQLLRETTDPAVVAVFRLAVAEAIRAPEVARTLDAVAMATSRDALRRILTEAAWAGLLDGPPADIADRFIGMLWGSLMVNLLLRSIDAPSPREISRRAEAATAAILRLYGTTASA